MSEGDERMRKGCRKAMGERMREGVGRRWVRG